MSYQTLDPEHISKTQEWLTTHGPCSSREILHLLNPNDTEELFRPALMCMMRCPDTWFIAIGDDNGLVGLDSQEKPGDGGMAAAARSLGLVEMMGAWIPKRFCNESLFENVKVVAPATLEPESESDVMAG
jgi:hypothetical protein